MRRFLLFPLLLLMAAFLFPACGEKEPGQKVITLDIIDNISEYIVVRGNNCTSDEMRSAHSLKKEINEATGSLLTVVTDYEDYDESDFEILIGSTNRRESREALAELLYHDYTIKRTDNKIVVVGGSDEALAEAVKLFNSSFIDFDKRTVKLPSGEGYTYRHKYPYASVTVEGAELSSFSIVNNSLVEAEAFAARIGDLFGIRIEACEKAGCHHRVRRLRFGSRR